MRLFTISLALLVLAGCTWETYQDQSGHTSLRPKYEAGTPVVYEDGSYARNQRYNKLRPQPHALTPAGKATEAPRTHWQ